MTEMFAEYFHHTPVGRNMIVNRDDRFGRTAILYGEDIPETIRIGLVRTEKAEVLLPGVSLKGVSQQLAELASRLMALRRRPGHFKRIVSKGRQIQIDQELSAIGMRIGSHATITRGCECGELRDQTTGLVEHFLWMIGAHPLLKEFQTSRIGLHIGQRDLVRKKCPLDEATIDLFGSGPPFGRTQDNDRPGWSLCEAMLASLFLIEADFRIASV